MNERKFLYDRLVILFAVLCLTIAVAETSLQISAQDASAFIAAGSMALESNLAVYPVLGDAPVTSTIFNQYYCLVVSTSQPPCQEILVPFVSPPPMLLLSSAIALFPSEIGILIFRLLAALSLGLGALFLYRHAVKHTPQASRPLAISFLILIPYAVHAIEHGQTSAWLFAAVVAGLIYQEKTWKHALIVGGLLAACTIAKLSPAIFALVLLWGRRWKALVVFLLATLMAVVLCISMFPPELFQQYVVFLNGFAKWVINFSQNISTDAAIQLTIHSLDWSPSLYLSLSVLKNLLIVGVLLTLVIRRRAFSEIWLASWLGWLVMNPINWWHYNWIAVACLIGIFVSRDARQSTLWILTIWLSALSLGMPLILKAQPIAIYTGAIFITASFIWGISVMWRDQKAIPSSLVSD